MTTSERTLPMPPSSEPPTADRSAGSTAAPSLVSAWTRLGVVARDRLALAGLLAFSAFLYLWNLTVSGYANTYYAMAAQAASKDWGAFFFGSLDAANFISLDKPPASIWLMGLSVRLLGLSSWSILLPQALLGVATVGVLFLAVRRSFGRGPAVLAAVVMALTPAASLIFRYDNPDALLTFVLVAGAWALGRGLEDGRLRWPVLAAALVGAGFLTKYLQAYLVLPSFALVWLIAAPGSLRRRIAGLLAAAVTVALTSGWWVAIVQLLPASARPYIGGSTGNSVLDLIFGYDGLGRIFGQRIGPGGGAGSGVGGIGLPGLPGGAGGLPGGAGGGPGAGFGGSAGLLRMFNSQFGGEVSWLIPLALLGLVVGLALHRRAGRRDPRLAGYLLWGSWLIVHILVFSLMSGIAHPYYSVMLAPAIGVLVGAGVLDLWRRRERSRIAGLVLAAGLLGSGAWALVLLGRVPSFAPGLGIAALALAGSAALILLLPAGAVDRRIARAALVLGLVAILAGPAAYSAATMSRALVGGDPAAGPATSAEFVPGGGEQVDPAIVTFLQANRGTTTWIVAAEGSGQAAPIQLATGEPVLTLGGFNGSDATPTETQLRQLVADGKVRFVLEGGRGGPPGLGGANASSWVTDACTPVDLGSGTTSTGGFGGAAALYDCAGVG